MMKTIIFTLSVAALTGAVPVSPVQANWGCGATDGTVKGRSWGFRNQSAAFHRALAECEQRSARGHCRLVSCNPNVNSWYDAHVILFNDAPRF
jgi:hypothetical protein